MHLSLLTASKKNVFFHTYKSSCYYLSIYKFVSVPTREKINHKSLLAPLSQEKTIPKMTSERIQCQAMFLFGFKYTIEHIKSSENLAAENLKPVNEDNSYTVITTDTVNQVDNSYQLACGDHKFPQLSFQILASLTAAVVRAYTLRFNPSSSQRQRYRCYGYSTSHRVVFTMHDVNVVSYVLVS